MSKNKLKLTISYAVLLIIIIFTVVLLYYPKNNKLIQPKKSEVYVKVVKAVERQLPQQINLIGLLQAEKSVYITAQVNGIISQIYFKDGQKIQKGQKILQLNDSSYKLALSSAKIQQKEDKSILDKYQYLLKNNAVSKIAYSNAQTTLAKQKLEVAAAQLSLQDALILAPFSGTLGNSKIAIGSYISSGNNIVQLVNTDNVIASYHVPGELYAKLKIGQKTIITSDAYPNKTFKGVVTFISPIITQDTNTVLVKATIPNPKHLLTSGMYVNIWQDIGKSLASIIIPNVALIPTISGVQVYIVKNGKAQLQTIKIGSIEKDRVIVIAGLKAKDLVVAEGQEKLKSGDPVKIIEQVKTP